MLIGLKVKTELPVIMLFFRLDAYFRSDKQINLVIYLHYLSLIRNFELRLEITSARISK